mgnify:FL=1
MYTLEQENQQLKKQLDLLLQNARENQQKQQRFEQFEFKLMSAESFEAILHCLENDFPRVFNYDVSSLLLINKHFSLSDLLANVSFNRSEKKVLRWLTIPVEWERLDK